MPVIITTNNMKKTYKGLITKLEPNQIAVIGVNPQGIHGSGAARWARFNAGLELGHSIGLCGQSYGIITKDLSKAHHPSIDADEILDQLDDLAEFSKVHPELEFMVFYSGTGPYLNGYTPQEMADMFESIIWPNNVIFEEKFAKLMETEQI